MSKTIFSIVTIVLGIAVAIATGGAGGALLGVKVFASATQGVLAGSLMALSGASQLLIKSPLMPGGFGQLYPQQSGINPRALLIGKYTTAGTKVFETTTDDEAVLWQVIVLGIGPIESIDHTTTIDGEVLNFDPDGFNVTGKYAGHVRLYRRLGDDSNPPAVQALVDASGFWTTAHQLKGLAYVVVKQSIDPEVLTSPLVLHFHGHGIRLYDPRLDDTRGGIGPHRMDQRDSWSYSDNPVLAAYSYLIGWRQNGQLVAGMGLPESRLIHYLPEIAASANEADETVSRRSGGSEKRYRACGILDASADHLSNLQHLETCMAGHVTVLAKGCRILCGAWQLPVATLGADDVLAVNNLETVKARGGLINTVKGSFANSENDGKLEEYPKVTHGPALAVDGQEMMADLALPLTPTASTAQRLAQIALRASRTGGAGGREPRSLTVRTRLSGLQAEPGDILELDLPYLFDAPATFRVRDRVVAVSNDSVSIDLSLMEETIDIWAWGAANDQEHLETPVLATAGSVAVVVSFAVAQLIRIGINDTRTAGLRVTWAPETNPALDQSEIRYRQLTGSGGTWQFMTAAPETGQADILPLESGDGFDVQMRHRDRFGRVGAWSHIVTATASTVANDATVFWSAVQDDGGKPEDGAQRNPLSGSGPLSFRPSPASQIPGALYYATDRGRLYQVQGNAWVEVASFNTGALADLNHVGLSQLLPGAATGGNDYQIVDTGIAIWPGNPDIGGPTGQIFLGTMVAVPISPDSLPRIVAANVLLDISASATGFVVLEVIRSDGSNKVVARSRTEVTSNHALLIALGVDNDTLSPGTTTYQIRISPDDGTTYVREVDIERYSLSIREFRR